MIKKSLAFFKKDFLVESSYKFAFIFNAFGILTGILVYFFIDSLFGQRIVPHLEEFGVNYFSYVLLGIAFFSYIGVGMGSFSNRIQSEQILGTLEAILLTPTKLSILLLSMTLWNLFIATIDIAVYIILGSLFFKINFSNVNILSMCIVVILTITSFSSLGILSASFAIVLKRGNPISWIISSLEGLIGGVYFPISILPGWLQFLAKFFPITYAVRAIELSVYKGYSVAQLGREIIFLLGFSVMLMPLALASFKYAIKKARKDATLIQY